MSTSTRPGSGPDEPQAADTPAALLSRREMLRAGALVGGAVAAAGTVALDVRTAEAAPDPTGEETIRHLPVLDNIPPEVDEDKLLRMQRDLVKAMAKPVEERSWVMVIDTRKCVGCHACTIACVAENNLPPGVVYRPVITEELGEFPNVRLRFTPRPCMQCDEPPCVPVCPVSATWKRPDGIVAIDYDRCIGCRYCIIACPYSARTSDYGESYVAGVAEGSEDDETIVFGAQAPWSEAPSHDYGKEWRRADHEPPEGTARKCHFCLHRLEVGQLPKCVSTCIGRATYFGDDADPDSLVSELIRTHDVQTLLPHQGTRPRVYYIV